MVFHHTHIFTDLHAFRACMRSGPVADRSADASAVLVQIYSMQNEASALMELAAAVAQELPQAIVVGASTVGEIAGGRLLTHRTVVGFTCLSSSTLTVIDTACKPGDESSVGAALGRRIVGCGAEVRGVLLLATPLSIDAGALLGGIESTSCGALIFGGGAGDYAAMAGSHVFTRDRVRARGAVAVVFSGLDLHIDAHTYLGWRPLSKRMRMTAVDGLVVREVDGRPAFEAYRHYLNIPNDGEFFLNALEFPFLIERDGRLLARVPVGALEDGSLRFAADMREGESFRFGYGDPELIVDGARAIHAAMAQEAPQAVFLFSCGCRRFLMQEAVELETIPFESLAPTFGFYTYGEFFGSTRLSLLNATMVAVSLREGPPRRRADAPAAAAAEPAVPGDGPRDPYANQHGRVVSRLVRFIDAVTFELEASHRELVQLSTTDRLTGLANRVRLDQVLDENLQRARRYATPFSVILLDIDHFKLVNDRHGHLVGDRVLARLAEVLVRNTRSVDTVGRWGGEEFMVVLPNTPARDGAAVAGKLREAVAATDFPEAGRRTCSFGVAGFDPQDDVVDLLARADAALYAAKHAGRDAIHLDAGPRA